MGGMPHGDKHRGKYGSPGTSVTDIPGLHNVELRGFEPLTPSMRTRCATGLRYSPQHPAQVSLNGQAGRLPAERVPRSGRLVEDVFPCGRLIQARLRW